jgi:hypothetical protein
MPPGIEETTTTDIYYVFSFAIDEVWSRFCRHPVELFFVFVHSLGFGS